MHTYTLGFNDRIVLYGAASTGLIFKRILEEHGLNVVAFLDKRAEEIETFEGVPVYLPALFETENCKEFVIIIAIKNVFEHEKIAEQFINNGFFKVIFRPYEAIMLNVSGKQNELNMVYDAIQNSNFDLNMSIPYATLTKSEQHNFALIDEDEEYCTVYLPTELIFTDRLDQEGKWNDISIFFLFPHIELFSTFAGKSKKSFDSYKGFCVEAAHKIGGIKTTESWFNSVLKQRLDVYNNMELNYELSPSFFFSNAPKVIYNGGRFNLKSGKHRIIFQILKGKNYVPVRMSKVDYTRWIERSFQSNKYDELNNYELQVPIFHPMYYQLQNEYTRFYSTCIKLVSYHLGKYLYSKHHIFDTKKMTIVDMSGTWGFFSRCLYRMQFNVYRYEDEINILTNMIDYIEFGDMETIKNIKNISNECNVILINTEKYNVRNINAEIIFLIITEKNKKKYESIFGPLKTLHFSCINGEMVFLAYVFNEWR